MYVHVGFLISTQIRNMLRKRINYHCKVKVFIPLPSLVFYHSIISFFFFNLIIIEVIADIIPKNPTVPLLILVRTTISGKLVLAMVGKRSPTICMN